MNCEAYSFYKGVSSDHRIVAAKVRLTPHEQRQLSTMALQEKTEKGTPNDEYVNFVEAHHEAVSKCIPTKPRTKYSVPWEMLAVREKRALVKTASKSDRKNPTNKKARKLENAQYQLAGIYLKEQTEYIQNQIDKIRDFVKDRQSRIAWQKMNEVSRRKSTTKAKN